MRRLILIIWVFVHLSCSAQDPVSLELPEINTGHLNSLYEEIQLEGGDSVGIIHIYADYPEYNWVGDEDEGIACVDDATRAAIFYLMHSKETGEQESLHKAVMLIKFVLGMQAGNGYFYNFIWPDHSIHKEGETTRAEAIWWAWRALWLFGVAENSGLLEGTEVLAELKASRAILVETMLQDRPDTMAMQYRNGFVLPKWLPFGSASDQASLMIIGLSDVFRESRNAQVKEYIKFLADGLIQMQLNDKSHWTYGAFRSWENLWHAYGNSQSYALLVAGEAIGDRDLIDAALVEINNFYVHLHERGGLSWFRVEKKDNITDVVEESRFSQIAYGIRPMVWACVKAHELTLDDKYKSYAHRYFGWFNGDNPSGERMYLQETGICYDGINSQNDINRNSGAESTIEALLALQMLRQMENRDQKD